MNPTNPLAQLRDIHAPPKPGFWPPTWEFWLLLVIGACLIVIACIWILKQRGPYWYREAKKRSQPLCVQLQSNPSNSLLQLNQILKQVALTTSDRPEVAHLQGQAWCEWLDQQGQCNHFTQGAGQYFGQDLYNPNFQCTPETAELIKTIINHWLDQQKRRSNQNRNTLFMRLKKQGDTLLNRIKLRAWRKPRHD